MKTLLTTLLLALMFVPAGVSWSVASEGPAIICHGGEAELSLMTLKVKKIVGKENKAEDLKNDLTALNGVKAVNTDTESGTVTISYNKAELGCCSAIHSALKSSKWKYELVSNDERPACTGSKPANGGCSHSKKKGA